MINAKTTFLNPDDGDAFGGCVLVANGNRLSGTEAQTYLAPNLKPGYQVDVVVQGVLTNFGGGPITLNCGYDDGQVPDIPQSDQVEAFSSIITAIRVSSIQ